MSHQRKMLIIDDERDFCALVALMMQREPYQIYYAYTLFEASQFLSKEHPEIVLLDHNLPDGTGLDYFNQHRIDFAQAKIVLMTADPSPEMRNRAKEAGIDFLAKPFGLSKIREMIKSAA
jgi:DNA-binding response OmpR family regulator